MKFLHLLVPIFALLFFACNQTQPEERIQRQNLEALSIVALEMNPDSLDPPITIRIDTNEVWIHKTPEPDDVRGSKNNYSFGTPRIVPASEIKIFIPGQDTVPLPLRRPAQGKVVPATAPELQPFKGWLSEDHNPGNFHYITNKDGLGFTVHDMTMDTKGNTWYTSAGSGITRFDGSSFANFMPSNGLPFEIVVSVFEDSNGDIWIGTNGGGAARYDGHTFTTFSEAEGLHNQITDFLETKNGSLWIGTYGGGLFRYDQDDTGIGGTFVQYSTAQGLCDMMPNNLLEDPEGNIWFKTRCNTIGKLELARDGKPERIIEYGPNQNSYNGDLVEIICDSQGNIWSGSSDGILFRFDGTNFTHLALPDSMASATINNLLYDKHTDQIKVAVDNTGIISMDARKPDNFTLLIKEDGLPNNEIYSLFVDQYGDLHTISRKAIAVKKAGDFKKYSDSDGFTNLVVNQITEDTKGNIWFATEGDGLIRFDGDSFAYHGPSMGFHSQPMGIIRDHHGNLWVASNGGGLHKFIPDSTGGTGTFHYYMENAGLSLKWMTCVMEDSKGNIWSGTNGGGINILTPDRHHVGGSLAKISTPQGLSSNQVYTIIEDRQGDIWAGMHAGGISRHRPGEKPGEGKWWHYGPDQGLAGTSVISLKEDHRGNIWIGMPGGLQLLFRDEAGQTERILTFDEKNSPVGRMVNSILIDKDSTLWFSSDLGLLRLTEDKYAQLLEKVQAGVVYDDDVIFDVFNMWNGFTGAGGRNASIQDSRGKIWLSSNTFLNAFDPELITADSTPPVTVISALSLANDLINWHEIENKKVTDITLRNGIKLHDFTLDGYSGGYGLPMHLNLAHDNNNITFGFSAMARHQPELVKYRYFLDGFDGSWSGLTTFQEVPYGNLPPGAYTFRVKAMNSLGIWGEEATYEFTIRPPWWFSIWAYIACAILFVVFVVFAHRTLKARTLRIEREKIQARELAQAKEIERAYSELNQSHEHLKSTQAQLIQSEKMASLGELTAGIAHEIQNPLNFVNNFSEVSAELLDEVSEELNRVKTRLASSPDHDDDSLSEAESILSDIKQNLEKITHHGKRADAIVKGMLAHSRKSEGAKEPTDLNALAEEYLKLSFHGLRAKDKTFNADFKTDFDPGIPPINMIPQDIGRVLLNIINNAFYAASLGHQIESTNENPSAAVETGHAPSLPRPMIIISTKNLGDKIQVSISDNGPGIPDAIKEKIFQPFFTTKPTGQGTGLGLSLSYDIVKAHGGEITLDSRPISGNSEIKQGTEFSIFLPVGEGDRQK